MANILTKRKIPMANILEALKYILPASFAGVAFRIGMPSSETSYGTSQAIRAQELLSYCEKHNISLNTIQQAIEKEQPGVLTFCESFKDNTIQEAIEKEPLGFVGFGSNPRPWKLSVGWDENPNGIYISDAVGSVVYASPINEQGVGLSLANARLLVEAVNNY